MAYTLKLQALVYRPVIRSDMPEAYLNRMTDEEISVWYEEFKQEQMNKGIDESMPIFKLKFDEKVKERQGIFEIFKDQYKRMNNETKS